MTLGLGVRSVHRHRPSTPPVIGDRFRSAAWSRMRVGAGLRRHARSHRTPSRSGCSAEIDPSPFLPPREVEFLSRDQQHGQVACADFMSAAGTLFPIAPCGRCEPHRTAGRRSYAPLGRGCRRPGRRCGRRVGCLPASFPRAGRGRPGHRRPALAGRHPAPAARSAARKAAHASQRRKRLAASAMSSVAPAKENRIVAWPRVGSKSVPGVAATPVSSSIRRQNATLSFVRWAMSA